MATTTITKVSGVLFIRSSANTNPKYYFGATGKYQGSDDNTTILITIIGPNGVILDQYTVAYADLTVGATVAASFSSALVMLNGIFGT